MSDNIMEVEHRAVDMVLVSKVVDDALKFAGIDSLQAVDVMVGGILAINCIAYNLARQMVLASGRFGGTAEASIGDELVVEITTKSLGRIAITLIAQRKAS